LLKNHHFLALIEPIAERRGKRDALVRAIPRDPRKQFSGI
jgi:hypothetical protein